MRSFNEFFKQATQNEPFDYQTRLACGEPGTKPKSEWTQGGSDCDSKLISIPTGCGKTAAVVLAWLWNRVERKDPNWARRLVFCLPMRTLVEQTQDNVQRWLKALGDLEWDGKGPHEGKVGLHILMGGEEREDNPWDLYPEHDAILIGTQDMLLSRALNRGYGMSRYRWPMHFGLLNTDCLWVLDEVQLMGSGLPTTAQLEAFRVKLQSAMNTRSWWMSATSERTWLKTVDFNPDRLGKTVELSDEERASAPLNNLLDAPKHLERATASGGNLKGLATEIVLASEKSEGLTLVVVNKVETARKLFVEVEKIARKVEKKPLLLHSRFRPAERAEILDEVLAAEGNRGIVISTQVIEAGVDFSAEILFTELAPWSSLVQRIGRCNRRGTASAARVVWFEPTSARPYSDEQLTEARGRLMDPLLAGVSPNQLRNVPIPATDRPIASHVIRRKDLVELFDTTPDLAGNDIDIDRWVREVDDSTVQLFWRKWEGGGKGRKPLEGQKQPRREELCSASIGEFRDFVKKTSVPVWRWDFLEGDWSAVRENEIYPGQSYLLPVEAGGYVSRNENVPATGWTPGSKAPVKAIVLPDEKLADDQTDADALSQTGLWQSISEHTDQVVEQLELILSKIAVEEAALLSHAARWHDWGKAHAAFQAKLKPGLEMERKQHLGNEFMAKAPKDKWLPAKLGKKQIPGEARRKFFRHELASALGVLQPETNIPVNGAERDLVAYLIAAHHGKIRLSIRSLPGEWPAVDAARFARGVWENDCLGETFLGGKKSGDGVFAPSVILSLEPMELGLCEQSPFVGLPSWSERMLALRDSFGPFRLAFLETLLRAADERASALATATPVNYAGNYESPGENPAVAGIVAGGTIASASGCGAGECLLEYVDGGRTGESRVAEGDTRPAGATRTIETTRGELAYSEVGELLASRASEIQPAIAAGGYSQLPLNESLLALFHRELCEGLVPDWAGKWRMIEVTVGGHEPPSFYQIPTALRDYVEDLAARWEFLSGDNEELLLETLAFAEGRYLSIHPFQDFNGRVARLWLREILRRADLPEVRLEVRSEEEKAEYFAALRAADRHDFAPLKAIWRQRLAETI